MKKKILITSTMMFVFLISASAVNAVNHYLLGYSAVDGGEIRWGGSTTYSTQWNGAVSTWNSLKKINIAPDNVWTYQDLTISDVNRSDGDWATRTGLYTHSIGSDNLQFNKYNLNDDTSSQKQNTTSHELGHALGLAHSFYGNLLYNVQTSQTSLGSQDRSDYGYLWGY